MKLLPLLLIVVWIPVLSSHACISSILNAASPVLLPRPWNEGLDFTEVERRLLVARPRRILPMGEYLTGMGREHTGESVSYFVEFDDNFGAVFKPEEQLFDSYGEIGTYQFSRWLNVPLVPPTVFRELEWAQLWKGTRSGSLQYYVQSPEDTAKLPWSQCKSRISPRNWGQMVSVLYPMAQWDLYSGNLILDATNTPALIDNAATMEYQLQRYGDYPFIFKGARGRRDVQFLKGHLSEIPYDAYQTLVKPDLPTMRTHFDQYLGPKMLVRWQERALSMPNQELRYLHWYETVWLFRPKGNAGPLKAECYDREILSRLETLNDLTLREILPSGFTPLHRALILDRTRQFTAAGSHGPWCE